MEWLTAFDWITPLWQLVSMARGGVQLEGSAAAIVVIERAGISVSAPMLIQGTGGLYLFTVPKRDVARARRVCARAGVGVW